MTNPAARLRGPRKPRRQEPACGLPASKRVSSSCDALLLLSHVQPRSSMALVLGSSRPPFPMSTPQSGELSACPRNYRRSRNPDQSWAPTSWRPPPTDTPFLPASLLTAISCDSQTRRTVIVSTPPSPCPFKALALTPAPNESGYLPSPWPNCRAPPEKITQVGSWGP